MIENMSKSNLVNLKKKMQGSQRKMRRRKKRDDAKENQGAGKYDGEQLTEKNSQSE